MKLKILKQLVIMSRLVLLGTVLQCLFYSVILAKDGHAQALSIRQIFLNINLQDASLQDAFQAIEAQTGFHFLYERADLNPEARITKRKKQVLLSDLLTEIAAAHSLRFKRINQTIIVDATAAKAGERVLEELPQQERVVTGQVVDGEDKSPLPGVNILLKGTNLGTTTDFDGNFSIKVPSDQSVLVFSYIGYQTIEVAVGTQTNMAISLPVDAQALAEVVVIGYGQQDKGDVTGVVAAVDSKNFNKGAILTPDQLINGKVAGVQITSNTGEPGGQSSIRIRGGTSINASNEPLYVIDGVPIDNSAHNPGGFQGGRNPLNSINPNDIETFTVLKDASATAIYGSRGANGVIIITTKKGKAGSKGRITYDNWVSTSTITKNLDFLDAQQFRQVVQQRAPGRINQIGNTATEWNDQLYRTAIGHNHALSFSGGSENMGLRASLGYQNQEGVLKNSNTERTSFAMNYNHRLLNDQLNIDANFKGAYTQDDYAPNGVIGSASRMDPTQPIFDPNNTRWGGYFEYVNDLATKNPVAELDQTQDVGQNFRSIGNIQFDYSLPLIEGLSAKLNLGYDVNTGERKRFLPSTLRSQYATKGEVRIANFTRTSKLMDFYLNYKKELEGIKSRVDVTAGYSYQDFNSQFPELRAYDLTSDLLGYNSTAPARQLETYNNVLENRLISFFGRANYALMDKYLLTFTLRRDGSSRFGESNRWGMFPSAALAWRLMDEPFMQGMSNLFSDLKVRVGWGITGNQEIGDYRYLPTYTFGDNRSQVQFGNQFITTLRPNGVDPNLKWEETESYNIGLDYGFLKGRLTGSLEYYYKRTDDLLFEVTVPAGANLTNIILTNVGSVENQGIEFGLNAVAIDKEALTWNLGVILAYNRNEILSLDGADSPTFRGYPTGGISGGVGNNIQVLRVGQPVNAFYVFKHKRGADGKPLVDGVDHNNDGRTDLADIYENTNGDDVVNDFDKVAYKQPAPVVTWGLSSNLLYKNFDFSFTLRGNLGNYVYNNVASNGAYYNRVINEIVPTNMLSSVLETNFVAPQYFSDVYIEKASFARMDNMTLGYTLNQLSTKMNLRIYATAQNLFVITDYSGLDPEIGNISNNNSTPRFGIDDNIFPRSRTFILGLNFGF